MKELTRNEQEVLELISRGEPYSRIARVRGTSVQAIKNMAMNIRRKSGAELMADATWKRFMHTESLARTVSGVEELTKQLAERMKVVEEAVAKQTRFLRRYGYETPKGEAWSAQR